MVNILTLYGQQLKPASGLTGFYTYRVKGLALNNIFVSISCKNKTAVHEITNKGNATLT